MSGLQSWIAGLVAALLGVLVISVLVGPRLLHLTPRGAATYTVGSLPPGVCALTTAKLELSDSTRVEAKLVTYDAAQSHDPDFPFRQYPPPFRPASWSRISLPTPTPPPAYYWVVAQTGTYIWNVNHLPSATAGPSTFHDVLSYVSADSCEGLGFSAGGGGWPAWFDKMPAVTDIRYK